MPTLLDEMPSFLELGKWTTDQILPLFNLFKDDKVAPALALSIFSVALALCALFLLDAAHIWIQISRRTRAVKRTKDKFG